MLRGNFPAKIDDKGRLKIPQAFRSLIEQEWGRQLFVTSLTGDDVRIYPLPIWEKLEKQLSGTGPLRHPLTSRLFKQVNYYGQVTEIDNQGRVLIHPHLRAKAGTSGDVDVLGEVEFLRVWNHERLEADLAAHPVTDEDMEAILAALKPE